MSGKKSAGQYRWTAPLTAYSTMRRSQTKKSIWLTVNSKGLAPFAYSRKTVKDDGCQLWAYKVARDMRSYAVVVYIHG